MLGFLFFGSQGFANPSIELSSNIPKELSALSSSTDSPGTKVDPSGFFSVNVSPEYFKCTPSAKVLKCEGLLQTKASVVVQISDVPEQASLELVALNQIESLESKTRFRILSSQRTTIDGMNAIIHTFTYDNLSNVMLPIWVQFIDVLQPKKLAVVQITCASRDCSEYGPALVEIQQSFKMAPILKNGLPGKRRTLIQK